MASVNHAAFESAGAAAFSAARSRFAAWQPPAGVAKITCIDAHTEGEPLRVIVDGFPDVPGDTILAKRAYARQELDHLRTALMWEPRGHADMYGCLITPPVSPQADFGVLFMHNEGYSTMCGHGIIAVTTVVLEAGMLPMLSPVTAVSIDTPAGLVQAEARVDNGRVASVSFRNVPSYVEALDAAVDVPGIGQVRYDIAFGGAYYAYVQASDVGLSCEPAQVGKLIEAGRAIKAAVAAQHTFQHPFEADLNFLYGTIFTSPSASRDAHSRNVCIFADGEVDRSPTGTGVSGRLALLHARGELERDQPITIESIIGSHFTGRIIEAAPFGPHAAVIPEVQGRAFLTGRQQFFLNQHDPFKHGFLLR